MAKHVGVKLPEDLLAIAAKGLESILFNYTQRPHRLPQHGMAKKSYDLLFR